MNDLAMTATTFSGLEDVLSNELHQLGATDVTIGKRAVTFTGDMGFLYKANYCLRSAIRVLTDLKNIRAVNEKQLYSKVRSINWNKYITPDKTISISVVGASEIFTHSQFTAQLIKDAIVDRIRNDQGERPSVDIQNADIPIHVYLEGDRIKISLDSSGQPLFKRGYRQETAEAPINEVLAAGILSKMYWDANAHLLDPMCGSGTFLIEAAMMATRTPAQFFREKFAFQQWIDYDQKLFTFIKENKDARIQNTPIRIIGYDIDPNALFITQKNIQSAGFQEIIELDKKDFFETEKPCSPLNIVFNPPYDERLIIEDEAFYQKIGDTLKHKYPNTDAWFITANLEAVKQVGLRPSRKIALMNGKLPCKLLKYELYSGSKKNKSTD